MTNSSMQAYLAAKYMSGPKADAILAHSSSSTTKKKKRKATQSSSTKVGGSSLVKDDDIMGWGDTGKDGEDEDDTMADAVIAEDRGFRKRQRVEEAEGSGWTTLQEGERAPSPPPAADEQPQVVAQEEEPTFTGGLLTSKQLKKHLPDPKTVTTSTSNEEAQAAQETIYRDSSGRKIDTKAERAEAARKKREKEEKEAKKLEWGKGLVQREEVEQRKAELEKLKGKDFVRRIDDEEMNQELKAQDRWNDPAAAFLTKKRTKGPKKPEYTGPPPPPNRFGIKPGYRWDGVDRSTGFEKKLFQHQNERRRRGAESYSWSVDDM